MTGMRALFKADWVRPVFIHFRVSPERLGPLVPFELDRYDDDAYVSLVAFTQARLRPTYGGRVAEWLSAPLSEHPFLNLRTYVRVGAERGIFFIAEWIPNRLAELIGPAMYGLPYRLGNLRYEGDLKSGWVRGQVRSRGTGLKYRGTFSPLVDFAPARPATLDHFLLERYIAYTSRNGVHRRFDVNHAPWPMTRLNIELLDDSLLKTHAPWLNGASPCLSHVSPGTKDVSISPPSRQTSAESSCTLWAGRAGAENLCPKPMSIPPS